MGYPFEQCNEYNDENTCDIDCGNCPVWLKKLGRYEDTHEDSGTEESTVLIGNRMLEVEG